MSCTRAELDGMLDELNRDLAMLVLNEADHEDLWAAFAAQADAICARAGFADIEYVRARMDAILRAQGIDPSPA
ncbi:MAG: hypothetical protein JSR34_01325 [Proteobacteria bacterium]|nr:hypothetical protein [Pseudomonadota bacterium]